MCGINGFSFKDEVLIKSMNKSIAHRGPDGLSEHVDEYVSLGHARLSIIDLSDAARQPMFYSHNGRNLCIVFNGELYNYLELKKNLLNLGYFFSNASDTEVIMAAYLEWGENLVNEFNGMWAFCLYDIDKNELFCSRDRLGVKPFYYYKKDGVFVFSSELKGILKHDYLQINKISNINQEAIELYFSMGYIPAPFSIYNNVFKMEAGSNIVYDLKSKRIRKKYKYYTVPVLQNKCSKNELYQEGKELLNNSVKLRMRSDVPVGAFLSGGLDSSAVVGEMRNFTDLKKLHTFSIGFEEKKHDESHYINLVKDHFGTAHHHHIYNEDDFNDTLPLYANIFDEPFGDYSSFPSYTVSRMASKEVSVVLSGDGGDEIFGGYPIYNTGFLLEKIRKIPEFSRKLLLKITSNNKSNTKLGKVNEALRLSFAEKKDFYSQMFQNSRYKPEVFKNWSSIKLKEALDLANNDLSEALRIYDLLTNTLPDNFLVKVDRSSMANSIEVRSPFLDYRFVEYSQRIPNELKVGYTNNKILMREIISGIVPKEIITRNKMGFTPPIHNWLYSSISDEEFNKYLHYLSDINTGLFDFYTNLFHFGNKDYMSNLYRIKLVIFGKWFEKWILKEDI